MSSNFAALLRMGAEILAQLCSCVGHPCSTHILVHTLGFENVCIITLESEVSGEKHPHHARKYCCNLIF